MTLTEIIGLTEKIKSELYGEITVDAHQVYCFPQGIVGMSHLNKFALLPYEDTELFVLQAFQEEFGLMLIPTVLCVNKASFRLDEVTMQYLEISDADEVITFFILRFIDQKPYVNVKAPIIISTATQKGCQYIISDDSLSVRELLVLQGEE